MGPGWYRIILPQVKCKGKLFRLFTDAPLPHFFLRGGCKVMANLLQRSHNCLCNALAAIWSLNADRVAFVRFLFWLSCNILNKHINGRIYELIFVSKKLEQDLKPKEIKPSFASQQCVVYKFTSDLCDADYVGYTARHLHQRLSIAKNKYSAIGKHLLEVHTVNLLNEGQFRVLKKCHEKFDCLVHEMLFIKELRPSLNTQSDSISSNIFVWLATFLYATFLLMN